MNGLMAAKLHRARTTIELTLEQVAEYTHINMDEIVTFENGCKLVNLDLLELLADFYGFSVFYFLDDNCPIVPNPHTNSPFIEDRRIIA
jgi:transcriptional regulator with XRE-family HTH domain